MWTMIPSHLLYRGLNENCNTPTKKDYTQATDKPSKIALLTWFVQAADTYQKNKNPTATHACGPLCTSRLYTCHGKRHEFYKCFSSGNELRSASGYTSDPVAMSSTGEEGMCGILTSTKACRPSSTSGWLGSNLHHTPHTGPMRTSSRWWW